MREVIFRGKRKDNGEWVEGTGVVYTGKETLIVKFKYYFEHYEVIPETIGEYTGLNDSTKWEQLTKDEQSDWLKNHTVDEWNGKKIFEGDIVKTQEMYDKPYSKNRKSKRHIGVVKYQIYSGNGFYNAKTDKWDRYIEYGAEWIVKVQDYGKFTYSSWGDFWDCEVIGNIHDNPELLKGGVDNG